MMQQIRRGVQDVLSHGQLTKAISEEKGVVSSYNSAAKEKEEAFKYVQAWGAEEEIDLRDFLAQMAKLNAEAVAAHRSYAEKYNEYRQGWKRLKEEQDRIDQLRKKIRDMENQSQKNRKKGKGNNQLDNEIMKAQNSLREMTQGFELIKRRTLKSHFKAVMAAQQEFGQKMATLGQFGGYLADQIPENFDPNNYQGAPTTARIVMDCTNAMADPSVNGVAPPPPPNAPPTQVPNGAHGAPPTPAVNGQGPVHDMPPPAYSDSPPGPVPSKPMPPSASPPLDTPPTSAPPAEPSGPPAQPSGHSAPGLDTMSGIQMKNMWSKADETGEWKKETRSMVIEYCSSFAPVVHCVVADEDPERSVFVKFATYEAAGVAAQALQGKKFSGNQITVIPMGGADYDRWYPDAVGKTTAL
eukprot:Clim_evm9s199 gene=Clim_evmTU9s199